MSITSPDDRISTYNPVVPTTEFPAGFSVFDNDDLVVIHDGEERDDFAVTATYVEGVATDAKAVFAVGITGKVQVVGARQPHRTNKFGNGPLPIRDFNLALDTLESEMQEVHRDISLALKVPYGGTAGTVITGSAGSYAAFDDNGNLIGVAPPSGAGNMNTGIYDPKGVGADAFDRGKHHGDLSRIFVAKDYGIVDGVDITTKINSLLSGLSNALIVLPPGTFYLEGDYGKVFGNNITFWSPGGRNGCKVVQKTWGLPCFATADRNNPTIRPKNVRFFDIGFEAWNGNTKCYFFDAFYGPGSVGPYTCAAHATTTADEVYVFRNLALETPASITGLGTSQITVTLSTPQLATDYISIKVTNKDDLYGSPSLWFGGVNQKASDSAAVFHGGGDGFTFERCHVEGFVCPVSCWGDWTSNAAGRQSYNARIYDVTFDNCDFILFTEMIDGYVDRIIGGKVSETQTDAGMTIGVEATYKDPHVIYVTDTSTLATTENLHVGILQGDNKYSSNYKFRNCRGLKVDGGSASGYFRHLDIEACSNSALNFNTLGGAFNDARDNQRAVFNLYGCTGVTINVERLYLTSDITRIARFRYGRTFGSGGAQSVCGQCVVHIKECFLTATAARSATLDWITDHGGVDCKVIIDKLYILGEMPNYLYRAREDDGGAGIAASRGGIRIGEIIATAANPNLKLATIASGVGGHPANMRVEVGKRTGVGGVWDASTFLNSGSNNRFIVDGQEQIALSAVVCAFATNGDAVFTPSNFTYSAVRQGDYVDVSASFSLATSAFTTSSGAFEIRLTGLPTPATDMAEWPLNVTDARGVDLGASTRHLGGRLNAAGNYITIREIGDDAAGSTMGTGAFAPAGASDYVFSINGRYKAA